MRPSGPSQIRSRTCRATCNSVCVSASRVYRSGFTLHMMARYQAPLLLAVSALAAAAFAPAEEYFPKPDSVDGWRTLKDASAIRKTAGMDLKKLDEAFEYASRSSQHGGLLVVRHGWLVYERYYGRGNREA